MNSYPPVKTGSTSTDEDDAAEARDTLASALLQMDETNGLILVQLRLLNVRFEAMAETTIEETDLEK